jgi:hypothetical protein
VSGIKRISEGNFAPIRFEALGREWVVKPITRSVWRSLSAIQDRVNAGDLDAMYEQFSLLTEMTDDEASSLSLREARAIAIYISNCIVNPEYISEVEKNGSGGGPPPSSS